MWNTPTEQSVGIAQIIEGSDEDMGLFETWKWRQLWEKGQQLWLEPHVLPGTVGLWSWEMLSASEILDAARLRDQDSISFLSQSNSWNQRLRFLLLPFPAPFPLPQALFLFLSLSRLLLKKNSESLAKMFLLALHLQSRQQTALFFIAGHQLKFVIEEGELRAALNIPAGSKVRANLSSGNKNEWLYWFWLG